MRFLREAMGGIALDDVQDPSLMRPDYSCLRGLLVVEVKSFEQDASQRMANVTKELEERGLADLLWRLAHQHRY